MRLRGSLAVAALPLLLGVLACAPEEDDEPTTASDPAASESTDESSAPADACAKESLPLVGDHAMLTIGTDSPAYEPWFVDNDPTNGKGFESAVAYAVAEELGFSADEVMWVKVPFNNSYAPGPKKFDFDINQISITPERAEVVDFSDGYYSAAQAVITLKKDGATPTSLADLASLKLGAQTGTTSLSAIRDQIQPDSDPLVFQNTNAAKQALLNGQVEAIVADLPTAFYITAVEIPGSTLAGQFQATGEQEEFGMLFEKGNPLVTCVNEALATLESDGTLAEIEQQWLSDTVGVPVLE
ncbi:MAG TPA: ABC transporter substrate-binding protein [Nocardioides sp.]|nr:ABC transporter substrate-binding protein [Nocardioides sp.]